MGRAKNFPASLLSGVNIPSVSLVLRLHWKDLSGTAEIVRVLPCGSSYLGTLSSGLWPLKDTRMPLGTRVSPKLDFATKQGLATRLNSVRLNSKLAEVLWQRMWHRGVEHWQRRPARAARRSLYVRSGSDGVGLSSNRIEVGGRG